MISDKILYELLVNPKPGSKNHYIATCPWCEKPNHFYINRRTQLWDCKHCSQEGNIFQLLNKLGKIYLLHGKQVNITRLEKKLQELKETETVNLEVKPKHLPVGFKALDNDVYLLSRGFSKRQDFERYKPGKTTLKEDLKDYIIFPVEEGRRNVGYVARCTLPKEQLGRKPRYKNDKFDASKVLYGIDDIRAGIDTVIVVEGVFKKKRFEEVLELPNHSTAVVATFGKKLSKVQMLKLVNKGIKYLVLVYDPDAVKASKRYGIECLDYFEGVLVAFAHKAPDDCTRDDVHIILETLETPVAYYMNKVQTNRLK